MKRLLYLLAFVGCGPDLDPPASSGTSDTEGVPDATLQSAAQRLSEAVCRKQEECGCAAADLPVCRDEYEANLFFRLRDTIVDGGVFRPDCLEHRITVIDALQCDESESWLLDWETRACPIAEPSDESAACGTPRWGVWPCRSPRWCDQRESCAVDSFEPCQASGTRCEDPALVLDREVGEACAFLVFGGDGLCAEGLVCDPFDTCNVGVAAGEACPAGETHVRCEEGQYCDCGGGTPCPLNAPIQSGVCLAGGDYGADCLTGEQCRSGACMGGDPLLPKTGTCVPPPPLVCDGLTFASF